MSLARKLKRSNFSKNNQKQNSVALGQFAHQVKHESVQQSTTLILAVMVGILWNDFGKLQKKNERLKNFTEMFQERLEKVWNDPDEAQLAAEAALKAQTDWEIIRQKISQKTEISV